MENQGRVLRFYWFFEQAAKVRMAGVASEKTDLKRESKESNLLKGQSRKKMNAAGLLLMFDVRWSEN